MKYILPLLFILISALSLSAQKDKTMQWDAPLLSEGTVTVTLKSKKNDVNYYEGFSITPKTVKPMRFRVSPYATNRYIIQILTKNKTFINEPTAGERNFFIPLQNLDTVNVFIIAKPTIEKSFTFYYNYLINDTAKLVVAKKPQQVFEQLLKYANSLYANLYDGNAKNTTEDISYPDGLFIKKNAYKNAYGILQYTAMGIDNANADKELIKWNKIIKSWLKDYNITEVKIYNKEQLIAKSNYLDYEATEYTKTNAQGIILFKVSVVKRYDEGIYSTAVCISHR